METRDIAIIGIWAFMIVLLILSFVNRMDLLVVFFLFFIALIVTIYLVSASGKNTSIIIIFLILVLILSSLYLTIDTRVTSIQQ